MTRPNVEALYDAHLLHQDTCLRCRDGTAPMCDEGRRLLMAWGSAENRAAQEQAVIERVEDELDGLHCPRCGAENVWAGRDEKQRYCGECRFVEE